MCSHTSTAAQKTGGDTQEGYQHFNRSPHPPPPPPTHTPAPTTHSQKARARLMAAPAAKRGSKHQQWQLLCCQHAESCCTLLGALPCLYHQSPAHQSLDAACLIPQDDLEPVQLCQLLQQQDLRGSCCGGAAWAIAASAADEAAGGGCGPEPVGSFAPTRDVLGCWEAAGALARA